MTREGRRTVVGVMGGGTASAEVARMAEELGRLVAEAGWVLLTGGRPAGVMEAASRGARLAGGLVIGVLPGPDPDGASRYVDVAIATNLADGRNLVNVLSSDVVIACPGGAGTLSEVAIAHKIGLPVASLSSWHPRRTGHPVPPITEFAEPEAAAAWAVEEAVARRRAGGR